MLFNSIEFAIFLPVVFALYWSVFSRHLRAQNVFLILVSYVFYGWWDWRFLSLIVFSSAVDYFVALALETRSGPRSRNLLLTVSLVVNLGLLGVFKYYNFFVDSFVDLVTTVGMSASPRTLNVILPVGISFYTFQTLSYTIDVYRKKTTATRDAAQFFAYVSFFPQLVAGPIERASNLLPQFAQHRVFDSDKARDGMQQILWGLFKKIVIADQCARFVDMIFSNYATQPASTLAMGAFLFAFQIYGDFSGYSDIAIGTARLFGFSLMRNFAYPYFSRDIAEFWRRWHISLSSWFRDYLYIPLGGSRAKLGTRLRNTFAIFLVSGFWHGANWTFLAWGFLNALYFVPVMLLGRNRKYREIVARTSALPSIGEIAGIASTFALTLVAWIVFRSESITDAVSYISKLFSMSLLTIPTIVPHKLLLGIAFLVTVEWLQRDKQHGLELSPAKGWAPLRWAAYYGLIGIIWYCSGGPKQDFIYFQF